MSINLTPTILKIKKPKNPGSLVINKEVAREIIQDMKYKYNYFDKHLKVNNIGNIRKMCSENTLFDAEEDLKRLAKEKNVKLHIFGKMTDLYVVATREGPYKNLIDWFRLVEDNDVVGEAQIKDIYSSHSLIDAAGDAIIDRNKKFKEFQKKRDKIIKNLKKEIINFIENL